jgi:hypothetical protein
MRLAHRRVHRRLWVALSLLLPALLVLSLAIRRGGPEEAAPVRLAPPTASPTAPPIGPR